MINNKQGYQTLLSSAAKTIRKAVGTHLTDGNPKSFMLWMLEDSNELQENYLRMLGVSGSVELELKLFEKMNSSNTLFSVKSYISLLNAYFAYETLSDNLGVLLAPCKKQENPYYLEQKKVLYTFNKIMIKKILGSKQKYSDLFSPITQLIKSISVNKKTLLPDQMNYFIDSYIKTNSNVSPKDLEHTFLEILILNIETCLALLHSLKNSVIYKVLQDSLLGRYQSVNFIINHSHHASLTQLAKWGSYSILTVPTLAYCIGGLEEVAPSKKLKNEIENKLLIKCLEDAALLTRLLNDIGTRLLTLNAENRKLFYEQLKYGHYQQEYDSIYSYLTILSERKEFFYPLTRIRKDLKYGEYNICLDGLNRFTPINIAIQKFCNSIDYYAEMFQQRYIIFNQNVQLLAENLDNDQASSIIYNFVYFHKELYQMEFETTRGDYAITTLPNEL